MDAEKINFNSIRAAVEALDRIGTGNSRLMAGRAIHINVLVRQVPGAEARHLKRAYNEIGAEAAVSRQVYAQEEGSVTDMIIMGTVYQHREVRRILADIPLTHPWLKAIEAVVENARETVDA
ncbi:MAG TPA: hypothetical protein VMC85_05860 [Desulfomonilaceae bacterium]|nr:hypothetical protein [Desulfomonilaceae bacterium]